jgi:hypothetical protein
MLPFPQPLAPEFFGHLFVRRAEPLATTKLPSDDI